MKKQTLLLEHNFRPSASEASTPPAIIMLHGFGSDEHDLFGFADELPDEYAIISLRAPIRLEPYGNAWYNIYFDDSQGKFSDDKQAIASRDLVARAIDEIVDTYGVDKNNLTLIGFSQGTILSFAVALSYPEKVKNVIGLSGYINQDILVPDFREKNFENLNIYTSHGTVDQVIPVSWARKSEPFFKGLGIACTYSEFPVGHGVSPENLSELKNWLNDHRV